MPTFSNTPKLECPINGALRYWFRAQRAADLADAIDVRAADTPAEFTARLDALSAFAFGMVSFARDVADGIFETEAIERNHASIARMAALARLAEATAQDAARLAQRAASAAADGRLFAALANASHAVEFALSTAGYALDSLRLAPLTTGERIDAGGALWSVGCLLCTVEMV